MMNANHQSGSPNELNNARPKDHRRQKLKTLTIKIGHTSDAKELHKLPIKEKQPCLLLGIKNLQDKIRQVNMACKYSNIK